MCLLRVTASSKKDNLRTVSIKIDISTASLSLSLSSLIDLESKEKHFGDCQAQGKAACKAQGQS